MANTVHEKLGVPVTYVVANPSSYAYLDASRPNAEGNKFGNFGDGRNCTTFNQWPYGIEGRKSGYTAKQKKQKKQKKAVVAKR